MTAGLDRFWFGGDFNPEQWPVETLDEDIARMVEAKVTILTVGVFSWATLEPREGEFEFDWLDRVLDRLHAAGIAVDLATATASPPPWLTRTYPSTRPITAEGTPLEAGSRQAYSPHSAVYRRLALRLVRHLAERYGDHPALVAWHVGNEYGCHVSHCYGDEGAAAFRVWLRHRYGSIDALNAAWGTAFWSQRYDTFEEIIPPRAAPYLPNPTQSLDFDRFSSDALLECYRAELAVLRELTPDVPVTTNFMGFFKPLDYRVWSKEVDFVSDDTYPDPADPDAAMHAALERDLMRSLRGGQPWILMEQSTSAVNWRTRNARKAPGQMRALSYQAIARGADGIMFFQWRQAKAGAEKFHSAMLPHAGTDTRIWREVCALGRELSELDDVLGASEPSRAALFFDWNAWWALEQGAAPAELDALELLRAWYRPLYERNVAVDVIGPGDELGGYDLVIVPSAFLLDQEHAAALARYAERGTLIITFQTGIVDRNAHLTTGGYLGPLADALGVRIEEFAPLTLPGETVSLESAGVSMAGTEWTEVVHPFDADVVARFKGGPVPHGPAVTRRPTTSGAAWYVATHLDDAGRSALIERALDESDIPSLAAGAGIEIVARGPYWFVVNQTADAVSLPVPAVVANTLAAPTADPLQLEPYGVALLRRRTRPVDG